MSHVPKLLYSRRDSGAILSLSLRSIDYLLAAGALKFRKVGAKILIPYEELVRFASASHTSLSRRA